MSIDEFDPLAHQGKMPSPCINICRMDQQTGLCEGCLRSIDEIVAWGSASEEYKRAVWIEIRRRQDAMFAEPGRPDA
jgi:predicted Fe-S protein YdhL (DUF1289 family)